MTATAPEMIVIGLDGATFDILDPLFDRGIMPNLARLVREGAAGPLESVIPTNSMAAWGTFMTGKNPGKHGVYEFRMPLNGDPHRKQVVTSRSLRARPLWHLLSAGGKRVGVVNVPLTYPPDPVDGFMVSGIIVPSGRVFTHPPELMRQLGELGEYRIAIPWSHYRGQVRRFVHDLVRYTEMRLRATLYLVERFPVDFLMVVFVGPDRLQHALWRYLDPAYPGYAPREAEEFRPDIEGYFRQLDGAVGKLLELARPATTTIVLSDHGFQSAAVQLSLDDWLEEAGYLARSNSPRARVIRQLKRLNQRMPFVSKLNRWSRINMPAVWRPGFSSISWPATRAFSAWSHQEGIRINVQGREPQGIVQPGEEYRRLRGEIRHRLLALRNPLTGDPVVERVLDREEYYSGPHVPEAADLILVPGRHIRVAPPPHQGSNFQPTGWASGGHHLRGIIAAGGRHVHGASRLTGARLEDVAPTILYLLGLPIPEDMDGTVLQDLIDPDILRTHPRKSGPPSQIAGVPGQVYSDEELRDVKEQLRGLGYLG